MRINQIQELRRNLSNSATKSIITNDGELVLHDILKHESKLLYEAFVEWLPYKIHQLDTDIIQIAVYKPQYTTNREMKLNGPLLTDLYHSFVNCHALDEIGI
jgi:hypothetical protein